jgi:hypothetical protein
MENFKPRDNHVGPSTAYLGQSHHDKDELEQAAKAIDQGPSFGTPGDPPDADPDSIEEIEKAYDDLDQERGVPRAG